VLVYAPAVTELGAHFLEVRVPHILDAEDEYEGEIIGGFLHVGEEFLRELLALLVHLGQVDDLGAFGFWHRGWVVSLCAALRLRCYGKVHRAGV
jgi:hypothetical protein